MGIWLPVGSGRHDAWPAFLSLARSEDCWFPRRIPSVSGARPPPPFLSSLTTRYASSVDGLIHSTSRVRVNDITPRRFAFQQPRHVSPSFLFVLESETLRFPSFIRSYAVYYYVPILLFHLLTTIRRVVHFRRRNRATRDSFTLELSFARARHTAIAANFRP